VGKKRIKLISEEAPAAEAKQARIRSGKADEARLADMGQKALADLEKIKAKEKALEEEIIKKASQKVKPETSTAKPPTPKQRSKRYQNIKKNIDRHKKYSADEAIALICQFANAKFDESVEVHLVTRGPLSGTVKLPYLSGKQLKVAVADEKLIEAVINGKIDFDILVASPAMMPKLAKVAKILGPKGLMPNPKNGTISADPEKLALSLTKENQRQFKTEPKNPLLHFSLGKVSLGQEKILANLKALIEAVKKTNILKAALCSTMGPGIKLDLEKI